MKKLYILALIAALLPLPGICANEVAVRILQIGTYGNGNLYLSLDKVIDEPGCPMQYIELPANSPAIKVILATATLAMSTNAIILVKTDGCLGGVPSLSGARTSYFGLTKP